MTTEIGPITSYDPNDGSDGIDAGEMAQLAVWRGQRFFGSGGLMERYAELGDELIQYGYIAKWLETEGLDRRTAIDRFVMSAKHGGFGWRNYAKRRAVANLVNLDERSSYPPAQYPIRPSALTVEMIPELMRARSSVWARWLQSEGLPVPPWPGLAHSRGHVPNKPGNTASRQKSSPKLERAKKAVSERWPNGAPTRTEMTNEELIKELKDKDKSFSERHGLSQVSETTILRAVGRKK